MFFGFGRAHRTRPTREHYEEEAAVLLASRIAEGRPPPEVWRKAEEWRAKRTQPDGWYLSTPAKPGREPAAGGPFESRPTRSDEASIGRPLVLRSIRLPVTATTSGRVPPHGGRFKPRPVSATD